MRRRHLAQAERDDPMGLFMDPIMDFIGLMFFMVIFLLIAIKPTAPLRYIPIEPPVCPSGLPYIFTLAVEGGAGRRTFADPKSALTALGLKLNPQSGTIFGIVRDMPAEEARKIDIEVRDDAGRRVTCSLTLRIAKFVYPFTRTDADARLLTESKELPAGREGVPYETVIAARGGLGRVRWTMSGLPPGLTAEHGRISGTPQKAGLYRTSVRVEFDHGVGVPGLKSEGDERELTLAIRARLDARSELPLARVGQEWGAPLFTSPLRARETIAVKGVPDGIASDASHVLRGVPTRAGSYPIEFRAVDGEQQVGAGRGTIVVLPPSPAREAPRVRAVGRVDEAIEIPLAYRGLVEPITLFATDKVAGLEWSGLTLRGVPKNAGVSSVAATLEDARGTTVTTAVTLDVSPPLDPLRVITAALPHALVGQEYRLALSQEGAVGRVSWTIAGDRPPWLKPQAGVLLGTPDREGTHQLTVALQDSAGRTVEPRVLELTVEKPERTAPVITTTQLGVALIDRAYAGTLAAEGGLGKYVWRVQGALPNGMTFDGGTLRGTPTSPTLGRYPLQVTVTDERGVQSAPKSLVLEIVRRYVPPPPIQSVQPVQSARPVDVVARETRRPWSTPLETAAGALFGGLVGALGARAWIRRKIRTQGIWR
jgi:hypothetical protein